MKNGKKGIAMRTMLRSGLVAVLAIGLLSCEERTDKTDGGGVLLSVQSFDGLPIAHSMNNDGAFVQVGTITVRNVVKNPSITTSPLMDVEINSYQVTYKRLDNGTRTPPTLVQGLFGTAGVNGTATFNNLVIAGPAQLLNKPLSDLLLANGGIDTETHSTVIPIEFQLVFFGKTLSGDKVTSNVAPFEIDFTP